MTLDKPIFGASEVAEIVLLLTSENLPIHTVAMLLNVDRMTLAKWRAEQIGPPFVRVRGAKICYPRAAFERFLKASRRAQFEVKTPERKPGRQFRRILSYGGLNAATERELHR